MSTTVVRNRPTILGWVAIVIGLFLVLAALCVGTALAVRAWPWVTEQWSRLASPVSTPQPPAQAQNVAQPTSPAATPAATVRPQPTRQPPQVRGEPLAGENPEIVGLGEGGEVIQNWYDAAETQIVTNTWGEPVFLLISSDPGVLTLYKDGQEPVSVDGRRVDGFGALVFLNPDERIEVAGVGMSEPLRGDDAHHQTWVEAKSFTVGVGEVIDYLEPWCVDQGKAFCYFLDPDGRQEVIDFQP